MSVINLDYLALSQREKQIYDAATFWEGVRAYRDGYAAGRADRMAEEEAAWATMASSIRAAGGPFAGLRWSELCELRGEREAADLARIRERLLLRRVEAS